LTERDFVFVETALRPGVSAQPSALELARSVGADVALDLEVDWRTAAAGASSVPGGGAGGRARAARRDGGGGLAGARFEAAGSHAERDAAIARALEAVEPQVGENLALQLQRNWEAVAATDRPIEVGLDAVSNLDQVMAVRRVLIQQLGAKTAEIR